MILIAACLFGANALAQQSQQATKTRKGEFSSLVRAGIVTSQIYNDDYGGYNKLGGTAGIGVLTSISSGTKFQFELNYAMRGSRHPGDPKNGDFNTYSIGLHYIDIPLLLKRHIWKFDFEAGICNGILLFSGEKDQLGKIPNDQRIWQFTRYELAANIGVNVPISEHWNANARFHYSILPAAGKLGLVSGILLYGGAYNNALSLSVMRTFTPKNR